MTAVTLQFQSTGTIPSDSRPVTMQGPSLTIGRGEENDVVLPDPDRMVSKTHCVIENQNGNVVVVDLSTNGTFLNYGKIPLGKTPTPLNDGDILSLGGYELMVQVARELSPSEILAEPMPDERASPGDALAAPDPMSLLDAPGDGGDFLDDLLGGSEVPVGPGQLKTEDDPFDALLPPLGEEEGPLFGDKPVEHSGKTFGQHNASPSDAFVAPTTGAPAIPDDWDDLLEGVNTPDAPDPFPTPPPAAAPPPPSQPVPPTPEPAPPSPAPADPLPLTDPVPPTAEQPAPAAAPAPPARPANPDAARALLESLDVEGLDISDDDLVPTMTRLGRVLSEMITGLREILMTRTSIKSEFRIEQTMISKGGNNPLKFSISPEQAIEAMVQPRAKGYLSADEATREALKDIKAHEIAMVTGMEAALKGVLSRLDPDKLGEQIEAGGGISGLLKGKKARYWEVYEKMYAEISEQAEYDFHELFAKEFARAYKDQLERLK